METDHTALVLHGYWRSGTSYRTRIALNAKGLTYDQMGHDLRAGAQRMSDYLTLNPQGLVPALEADGHVLTQSSAIIEWLEERYPDPPLLPAGVMDRAVVRAMAMLVACDVHPLNNMRVLNRLRDELGADPEAVRAWIAHWIAQGFGALELLVARHGGRYCFGDRLTLADCHIVPQYYSAERFAVDLSPYPCLTDIILRVREDPAVAAAHPDRQPDAG
ncbi:maleylacetoacetate isomerase [Sphingobium sp. CR2-8]|uniref:maleylacetoacetate isomerase n=1 Tax=Sphingobium sp. CR2-8 TaxID=1306534 RepID=UPI002DB59B2D|nr:maleylacetoacetate isomerase [Sphingobium sp. CR2-8]MEC3909320.1 maleylacetoacetate isomerase [Sphingobium sp. CR2-8]